MRCRKLYAYADENGIIHQNVVWFGSAGVVKENAAILHYQMLNTTTNEVTAYNEIKFIKSSEGDEVYNYINVDTNDELIVDMQEPTSQTVTFNNLIFNIDTTKADNGFDYLNQYIYITLTSGTSVYSGYVEILNSKIEPLTNDDKNINYAEEQEGVAASLIQRLSVLKKELWYRASYGLPLLDKIRNKGILDAIVIDIIMSHPDIENLISFGSEFNQLKHQYSFVFSVLTTYTDEEVKISLSLSN